MEYVRTSRFGYKGNGIPISASKARKEFTLWKYFDSHLGGWQVPIDNLGGWNLSVQHTYDPISRLLYFGDGPERTAQRHRIRSSKRQREQGLSLTPAISPWGRMVASMPSPAVPCRTLASKWHQIHSHRDRCGMPNLTPIPCGDGGPANQARISTVKGFAVGSGWKRVSGRLGYQTVRRISPDGIITTVAGTGVSGTTGDGGPATQARLQELAGSGCKEPDNSIYVTQEANNPRIRRVMPDGTSQPSLAVGLATRASSPLLKQASRHTGWPLERMVACISFSNRPGGGARVRHVRLGRKD